MHVRVGVDLNLCYIFFFKSVVSPYLTNWLFYISNPFTLGVVFHQVLEQRFDNTRRCILRSVYKLRKIYRTNIIHTKKKNRIDLPGGQK